MARTRRNDVVGEGPRRRRRSTAPRLPVHQAALRGAPPTGFDMLRWALIFAVIAIVAGALGFTGIEAGAADIARLLFYVFLAIVVIFLVLGLTIFRR